MYQSNVIENRYLAATMVKQSEWLSIAEKVNDDYASQRMWLLLSLAFFGAWLISYLLYWVLAAIPEKDSK